MIDFRALRFDKDHHLGLGDVRLTIDQQEEIEEEITMLKAKAMDGTTLCGCGKNTLRPVPTNPKVVSKPKVRCPNCHATYDVELHPSNDDS